MVVQTSSPKETQDFGEEFAKQLVPGSVVCLYGDLGAGKTTLVQGIAKGLGIKKRLISPTFILARRYRLPKSGFLWHIDLYRLQDVNEVKAIGIEELISDPSNILLIEWPEKIEKLLPKSRIGVKLETIGEQTRKIYVNNDH